MSDNWDGIERRNEGRSSDLAYALSAIGERLKAIEEKFSLKVEHVCTDVDEIKQADDKKHLELERRIYQRVLNEFQKISNKLEILMNGNSATLLSIQKLDGRVDGLESRIKTLEDAGKNKVYSVAKQIGNKALWIVLGVIGAAVLYAIFNQSFWERILNG